MRPLIAFLALALAGCTSPAMDPDLSLHDRFMMTAMANDAGEPEDTLWRWDLPVLVQYDGPEQYREDVANHLGRLAEITGLWVIMDADRPNMYIEISDRDTASICQVTIRLGIADIHIWSALPPAEIRQCILQEITQALGPMGDLDGLFGSRQDTVFASWGGADHLTDQDRQILQILFDDRLYHGMPRDEVLAILPAIVADVEAEQEAGR